MHERRGRWSGAHRALGTLTAPLAVAIVLLSVSGSWGPALLALPTAGGRSPRDHAVPPGPGLPLDRALTSTSAWPGTLARTLVPNANGSLTGNFPSTVNDWQVGVPVFLSAQHAFWWPQRAVGGNGTPTPTIAPALEYSAPAAAFTGLLPAVANVSSFALDSADNRLYAAEPAARAVGVLSPSTGAPLGPPIPVGSNPVALALYAPLHELFVANAGSNNVSVIDTRTDLVSVASVPVGNGPVALAVYPASVAGTTPLVYVANANSSFLSVINASDPGVPRPSLHLSLGPAVALAYSQSSRELAVAEPGSTNLTIVDATSATVLWTFATVGPGVRSVASSSDGSEFVVANALSGTVRTVGAAFPYSESATVATDPDPTVVAVNPASGVALVWSTSERSVDVVNLSTMTIDGRTPPMSVSPELLVAGTTAPTLFVGDPSLASLARIDRYTGANVGDPIALSSPPTGLALSPDGSRVIVAEAGGLSAYDTGTGALRGSTAVAGAGGPLLLDPATGELWMGVPGAGDWESFTVSGLAPGPSSVPVGVPLGAVSAATVDPASGVVYVLNASAAGRIVAFNGSTGGLIASSATGVANLSALLFDPLDHALYAAGDTLVALNATSLAPEAPPVAWLSGASVSGASYDPDHERLLFHLTGPGGAGWLASLDASSALAADGSVRLLATGYGPGGLAYAPMTNNTSTLGAGELLLANAVSGTVSVLGDAPKVGSFVFSPPSVDLGGASSAYVALSGGIGPATVNYSGLPPGCASANTLRLLCDPSAPGAYNVSVAVTDAVGGTDAAVATLLVAPALSVVANCSAALAGTADAGVAVNLSANATGGVPGYRYSWSFGDGSTAVGSFARHTYSTPGVYAVSVLVNDTAGGVGLATLAVTVVAAPTLTIAESLGAGETDVGLSVNLSASVHGGTGPGRASWSFGDGSLPAGGLAVTHAWLRSGTFVVNVAYTDHYGSVAVATLLEVVHAPLATNGSDSAGTGPVSIASNVSFAANVSGGTPPVLVSWLFGDGSGASGAAADHAYASSGVYTVTLRATDAAGAAVTTHLTVTVASAPPSLFGWAGGGGGPGVVLGIIVGAAVAAVALFVAERRKHGRPLRPPSPYEGPPEAPR